MKNLIRIIKFNQDRFLTDIERFKKDKKQYKQKFKKLNIKGGDTHMYHSSSEDSSSEEEDNKRNPNHQSKFHRHNG